MQVFAHKWKLNKNQNHIFQDDRLSSWIVKTRTIMNSHYELHAESNAQDQIYEVYMTWTLDEVQNSYVL